MVHLPDRGSRLGACCVLDSIQKLHRTKKPSERTSIESVPPGFELSIYERASWRNLYLLSKRGSLPTSHCPLFTSVDSDPPCTGRTNSTSRLSGNASSTTVLLVRHTVKLISKSQQTQSSKTKKKGICIRSPRNERVLEVGISFLYDSGIIMPEVVQFSELIQRPYNLMCSMPISHKPHGERLRLTKPF